MLVKRSHGLELFQGKTFLLINFPQTRKTPRWLFSAHRPLCTVEHSENYTFKKAHVNMYMEVVCDNPLMSRCYN